MNSVTVTMDNKNKNEPRLDEADTFLEQNGGQEEGKKKNNKSEFIVQLRQSKDFRHKIIHTAIVCWSFITLVCMVELNILFLLLLLNLIQIQTRDSELRINVGRKPTKRHNHI